MVLTKKVKGTIATAFVMASMCFGTASFAQGTVAPQPQNQQQQTEEFSDSELQKFVQASEKAMTVQQKSQQEMMAVIEEEENISVEKFNEMVQAHQQQKLDEVNATPEEMAAFNNAAQQIMEMQPKIQQEVQQAIEEEGISVDKFERIMLAYQQNPAVQAKINQIAQEQGQ